jgi:hypothetical protein
MALLIWKVRSFLGRLLCKVGLHGWLKCELCDLCVWCGKVNYHGGAYPQKRNKR